MIVSHDGKIHALTDFFSSIIGESGSPTWRFEARSLFQDHQQPSWDLTTPFTESETLEASKSMDRTSAPGPNGFGPSFYRVAWRHIKPQVIAFLSAFYHGQAQLERINRSYMVLIPKKPRVVAVDAFRPICM